MSTKTPKPEYKPCDGVAVICPTLRKRLGNGHQKGFNQLLMMNFSTGEEGPPLLAYKSTATDRGIILNYCPFCGQRLNLRYVEIEPANTANDSFELVKEAE
jgi:hypothetical protein